MLSAAEQAERRAGWAVRLGLSAAWIVVYVMATWPRLGRPLTAAELLAHGALPTPLTPSDWPRLFTTWLVHVDPLHLLGNLAAWGVAWLPGPAQRWVTYRLVAFGMCGLGASLAVVFWYGRHLTISAGPSGALVGLLVVLLVQRGRPGWSRAVWLVAGAALLVGGVLTAGDTAAHLGGALTGLALGLLWRVRMSWA